MANAPGRRPHRRVPRAHDAPDIDALLTGANGNGHSNASVSRETSAHEKTEQQRRAQAAADAEAMMSVRPDPRHEMRAAGGPHEESSRERAIRRTAEIMGHLDENLEEGVD